MSKSIFFDNHFKNFMKGAKTPFTHPYNYDPFVIYEQSYEESDKLSTVYSDRLFSWDPEKHNKLTKKYFNDISQHWDDRDPELIEKYLQEYLEYPNLKLIRITQHCNQSSGYPCWQMDYIS